MQTSLMKAIRQAYRMDESLCLQRLLPEATLSSEIVSSIQNKAMVLIEAVRQRRLKGGIDAFLTQYDLSSEEGIALMCLAEALLRIPDAETIDRLIRDKITGQDWERHLGKSQSWFVNAATWSLMLTGKLLAKPNRSDSLFSVLKHWAARSSKPVVRQVIRQAMKILGQQFVMAETIENALARAEKNEVKGYRYSFDMLGEAAKTQEDAVLYLKAYQQAIEKIGLRNGGRNPLTGPGISVKLSALHPRYEWVNRKRVQKELLPILKDLVLQAKAANIGFTIDAEEADRLELSLLLVGSLARGLALGEWQGLGLAVQAYQKRADCVIDWLIDLGSETKRRFMVRLVKGAYWDAEIKWSQERGLKDYPVFTRKASTDVCFLACASKLFKAGDKIYPQFATHNAYTVAAIQEMAKLYGRTAHQFEFQALHGMGDPLYDGVVKEFPCRVYAPVGGQAYLLAYLLRRLLENGANTSFVNRILDEKSSIEALVQDPVARTASLVQKRHPQIPLPGDLFQPERPNSPGLDITDEEEIGPLLGKIADFFPTLFETPVVTDTAQTLSEKLDQASQEFLAWSQTKLEYRAACLAKMAELLEKNKAWLIALIIREAGRTVSDAHSELREAIDFCWYYRARLLEDFQPQRLPGPTGEYNQLLLQGRGVMVCISPWNFPLAIFLGEITAALSAGNTVIAKPSSLTPKIGLVAVKLLQEAGFPAGAVQCVVGDSASLAIPLLTYPGLQGVLLTGSTQTAWKINQTLAARLTPIVPFIAETGGQNVMIVDSSALPEQVVTDVITSAFNSAGQRCSALRILFIQEDVFDRMVHMLKGAMAELKMGDPFDLSTDVGPVIDEGAYRTLQQHAERMNQVGKLIFECPLPADLPPLPKGVFFAPRAYEIASVELLKEEVFGPILHVVQYASHQLEEVMASINKMGYGLTLGIHSRIIEFADTVQRSLRVGNTYINRNMIGAVVGVQPFGGEGLSGTGPKAGGPHMLPRLAVERVLSVNTAAMGGNTALLSLVED